MQDRQRRNPVIRILQVPRAKPWLVNLPSPLPRPKSGSLSPLFIVYGFAAVIALGTLLLWLPISSKSGEFTRPIDALFTSTSAVCVTGLAVVDIGSHYSTFGQGVMIALMQIGGFGIMTIVTVFLLFLRRRVGLRQKLLIADSMGVGKLGGELLSMVKRVAIFTFAVEAVGVALLYVGFSDHYSSGAAAWKALFTGVSAFNNAGFDNLGTQDHQFYSVIDYQYRPLILLTIASLIIIGGLSYIVFADVFKVRGFARLMLDSKIVLITTVGLLAVGTAVILTTEFSKDETLGALPWPNKVLNAFFMSVVPRTAGFASINMGMAAEYTAFFIIILMFIGGAAGSTAGGIKVNTFGLLAATIWSTLRGKERPGAFGREFKVQDIHRALALVILAMGLITLVVLVLTMTDGARTVTTADGSEVDFNFMNLFFETVSAFGTVGLSRGVTPFLTVEGKTIIIATMFIGRIGPLALALSLVQRQRAATYKYPQESVRIG